MAKARKASQTQSKLGVLFYGKPFTGKSTLASQFIYYKRPDGKPFRILYLDCESGSIDDYLGDFEQNGVNLDNLYIVYTQSLSEVRYYIAKVKNDEDMFELDEDGNETEEVVTDADGNPFRADAIVVDGVTILNLTTKQGLIEFSKKRNAVKAKKNELVGDERVVAIEGAGLELKDYQTVNFKGQDLVLDLMSSGAHYAITTREANEKVTVKTQDGKTQSVDTGNVIPDGFKGMDYNVKTVIRTYTSDDGSICARVLKDRTGVHGKDEILEDPSFLDWQVVIDKTKDNKAFVLKNDLSKAVSVEQDMYTKEILKSDSSIPTETKEKSSTNTNIAELKTKINTTMKEMNPVKRDGVKKNLASAGYPNSPSKINAISDETVLSEILKIIVT